MLFTAAAVADLVLEINPFTDEFALTGSDFVNDDPGFTNGIVAWQLNLSVTPDTENVDYDNDLAFTTSVGTPGGSGFDTRLRFQNSGDDFFITLAASDFTNTFTGSGVFQSYAGFNSSNQTILESLGGETLTVINGTALPISVVIVPEPSSYVLLGSLGFAILLIGRSFWSGKRA